MKKLFISLVLTLVCSLGALGQDARNRLPSTIVGDVLATLPATTQENFNEAMADLAATGEEGVQLLSKMLLPPGKGDNSRVEYALHGLVGYVYAPGREKELQGVRDGLRKSLEACEDDANRAFLLTLLQRCGDAADAPFIAGYINDPYLQEWAVNALVAIPGTEEVLLKQLTEETAPRDVLAYAAGKKGLASAEPIILGWIAEGKEADMRPYYKALGELGSAKSLPVLAKAAKKSNYEWDENRATEAYVRLVERLAADGNPVGLAEARKIMKSTDKTHVKGAMMNLIFASDGKKSMPLLLAAMKGNDRAYRVNALRTAEPWADDEVYATLGKLLYTKGNDEMKADILNWFGTNHVSGQIDAVIASFASKDPETAEAAVKAAGKIGGDKALNALIGLLDSPMAETATGALMSFNGKVNPGILKALDSTTATQVNALKIASARRMTETAPKVFSLLSSDNAGVAGAALSALPGVVSDSDFGTICGLIEAETPDSDGSLSKALLRSLRNLPADRQYAILKHAVEKSKKPWVYFPAVAQSATPEAIAYLVKEYSSGTPAVKDEALTSLMTIDSPELIEILYNIGVNDRNEKALARYASLVASGDFTPEERYLYYRKGLEAAPSAGTKSKMIKYLGETLYYPALLIAGENIADAGTARASADAIRQIASKNNGMYGGAPVKKVLESARDFYKKAGGADDGYAVDDINGLLEKLPTAPFVDIEDKAYENFDLIFEWQGEGKVELRSGVVVDLVPEFKAPEWNTGALNVVNDRLTLLVNGKPVKENITMTGVNDSPVSSEGKISISGGDNFKVRGILVRELPSTPLTVLSPEEQAEGFKLLFDGRSMHNFVGNKTDYIPVDGNILVSAKYGSGGNLYTTDEYSDFIFRFEFCFDKEGVNNGVGLRTPMGVDAAYEGMEIQILDHDAPIYADWLKEYQQHGSVYGILPAKRVVHKPLGEWSTEEIRAVGDHITVTVNGEVILDGDIREACQGHNVAPDGSDKNPYTVDHRNHPGLFNKKGHVGFLGHGSGVKFRNIRIKDLSKGKKSKK